MYSYIIGKVAFIESDGIVMDNNGIGYKIFVANPYHFTLDKEYKIYLYNHVREEEYSLFGFETLDEKDLFLKLISVKGLGPKIGLVMISGDNASLIDAIDSANISYITKYPKVGEKLARQIILDLKGKLAPSKDDNIKENEEVVLALESLGYKKADIKKVLKDVNSSDSIEKQIKDALKLLLKN